MNKHMPGPWTTEEAPHQCWIASVGHNMDDPQIWSEAQVLSGDLYHFGDKDTDACLIAAAPEMLTALQELRKMMDDGCDCIYSDRESPPCPCRMMRAAIAKAQGLASAKNSRHE